MFVALKRVTGTLGCPHRGKPVEEPNREIQVLVKLGILILVLASRVMLVLRFL